MDSIERPEVKLPRGRLRHYAVENQNGVRFLCSWANDVPRDLVPASHELPLCPICETLATRPKL